MTEYDLTINDFEVGGRVELHPATDAWMAGDRFGTVTKIGRKYLHVHMDRSDKVKQFSPENVGKFSNTDVIAESQEYPGPTICDENISHDDPIVASEMYNPVIGGKTFFPAPAQVFNVDGMRISTRSSVPWKRKLAKKLVKKAGK